MTRALSLLMQDDAAALGAVVHDRGPEGLIYESYLDYMKAARAESGKPVALVSARQGTGDDDIAVAFTRQGYPAIDGVSPFLRGVRALLDYRDFVAREPAVPRNPGNGLVQRWHARLRNVAACSEADALSLLVDFGVPAVITRPAPSRSAAIAAAAEVGYPVVLKTAEAGIHHKSDHGGVVVNIPDESRLAAAYDDLAARLGPAVLVCEMARPGIEMFLGVRRDPQFGPVVLIGFGGVHAETLQDVAYALPPFDAAHVRRCVDRLRLRPLLDGLRGSPAVDVDAFAIAAARFSELVHALRDHVAELDVNPVIVGESGCVAVDALLVPHRDHQP